eukprot:562934-Ditylum_brightwellii.AAC.1
MEGPVEPLKMSGRRSISSLSGTLSFEVSGMSRMEEEEAKVGMGRAEALGEVDGEGESCKAGCSVGVEDGRKNVWE